MSAEEFEDGLAVANLLPGPSSTQLAIFCAFRLGGPLGALIGGVGFIAPGLVLIIALSAVFLASHPPLAVEGAAAGAGAAVPAIAVAAAIALVVPSWRRTLDSTAGRTAGRARWVVYAVAGAVGAALAGPWLVLVIVVCGTAEVTIRTRPWEGRGSAGSAGSAGHRAVFATLATHAVALGGLGALAWEAFKVGALSFGGGFVIIPLMQHDAVDVYHFMSAAHFLDAVALGQVTPGPVVQTVAAVGYAAHGIGGALLAAGVAFAPSFLFVIAGGPHFDRIRTSTTAQAFLAGAGPAAIGAIAGAAIPLGDSLAHLWQVGMMAAAAVWLIGLRRPVVSGILAAGVIGAIAALAGAPVGV
jgi:chromate transporter